MARYSPRCRLYRLTDIGRYVYKGGMVGRPSEACDQLPAEIWPFKGADLLMMINHCQHGRVHSAIH
jgi:hypothetical protein